MARKILLADDSVTAQNMGRKILADAGYEVITVNNGSAALKKIAEAKPDLIVLDVYMPGYSGLEVCQRLKEAQETSRIPILLTVGKLEPFKPEEAKRVRAEGYIVKPFEASELLAALTKLEDKIVPRAEASKPGRFARANAAIDEGRAYDKSVAAEEDSGWKNRISFPSKKKKAAEEREADEPAIYNAVNKDLRTVVEPTVPVEPYEQQKVDLGALAPEGLPKDVTPEEIAALAAAAAQVKGKLAEEFNPPAHGSAADAPTAEFKPEVPAADIKAPEVRTEEPPKIPEAVAEVKAEPAPEATFAAQKSEADQLAASLAATMPAEVAAAISGLDSDRSMPVDISSSPVHHAEEPVTMAAAAGVGGRSSRWAAVSVALTGDEAAVSLEQEMQKAHAAFAAAENARFGSVVVLPERPVAPEPARETSSIASAEPAPSVQDAPLPALSAEAIAAAETMRAVVRQFETVSAPKAEPPAEPAPVPVSEIVAAAEAPAAQESTRVETPSAEPIAPAYENSVVETLSDIPRYATSEVPALEVPAVESAAVPAEQPREPEKQEEPKYQESRHEESKYEEPKPEQPKPEEPAPVAAVAAPQVEEAPSVSAAQLGRSVTAEHQVSAEPSSFEQSSSEPSSSGREAASPAASTAGDHKPAKESEIHETTAAAWASWRRIRESGDKSAEKPGSDPETRDLAAMAVAAGAEKAPDDPSNSEDPGEIANIVDSVLADLRPKIVAEISKKMGKKK